MYQYQFFPFLVAASFQPGFEDLPVEIAALVFRYLDGQSLLNVVRSSRKFASICRGDPILRKKVRGQLKKEIQYKRQILLDPRLSVIVSRQGDPKLFQTNASTNVVHHRQQFQHPGFQYQKQAMELKMRPFNTYQESNGGQKIKRARTVRSVPYTSRRLRL